MTTKRLQSLDIVRGFTVAGMILVNNGHSGQFEALRHARWDGLTLCDLVFPFFLFIMGVAIWLSLSSGRFEWKGATVKKIIKRSLLLILIGLAINWIDRAASGDFNCLSTLRFWAVLQRIALCYLVVALLALTSVRRHTLMITAILAVIYSVILTLGHGFDYDSTTNVLAKVDLTIFGYDHLYHKSPVDPEGLVGTLSSLINVLLGFYCGKIIKENSDVRDKVGNVLVFGSVVLILGYLLSFAQPFNKRVWSVSFAFATSGWCTLLLGVVMHLVDGRNSGYPGLESGVWNFFKVFGVNALFLYVFSELLSIAASECGLSEWWFGRLSAAIPLGQIASLVYALTFVAVCYAVGWILRRRGIYIKL